MATLKWGSEFLVNTTTAGNQDQSSVTALADGGFVVTWRDDGPVDSLIRWQRYDATGVKVGVEQIFGLSGGDQSAPGVVQLSDGNLWFVDQDFDSVTDDDIDGAVYTLDGVFVRSQAPNTSSGDQHRDPANASLGANGSVAVYYDATNGGGNILMRGFNTDGTQKFAQTIVNTNAGSLAARQHDPAVAASLDGSKFVATWYDDGLNTGDVRARVFNADGTQAAAEFTINTLAPFAAANDSPTGVTWLDNNRFVVTWTAFAFGGNHFDIKYAIYNADGTVFASESLANSTTFIEQSYSAITRLANGGFAIAWRDFSHTGADNNATAIRLQAFDGSGNKTGGEILVNTTTSADQSFSSLAALADGRVIVTWTDYSSTGSDTSGLAVRAQIVDPRDGVIDGTAGNDKLYGHDAVGDVISAGNGDDTVFGLNGNDTIYGSFGIDRLFGGRGDDTLIGGADNDKLFGGAGADTAVYDNASNAVGTSITRLADGSVKVVTALGGTDILRGVEQLQFTNTTVSITGYARTDLNGDGDSDVLIFSQSGGAITRLDMQGGFQSGSGAVASPGSGAWDVQRTGDFNADGVADIVLKNQTTGQFQIFTTLNGVQNTSQTKDLGIIGTTWDVVSTGDYNSDGVSDLLWRNSSNGQFYVFTYNSSLGQTGSTPIGTFGTNWKGAPSGDFNGDGASDILMMDNTNGDLYFFNMNNATVQSSGHVGIFGADWSVAGVGDVNGDTNSDIILKNTVSGQFYMLLMNDNMTYTGSNLGTIGTQWNVAETGDFNADGTDDILWRNSTTNQVYVWTMDNGVQASTGSNNLGFLTADQILV